TSPSSRYRRRRGATRRVPPPADPAPRPATAARASRKRRHSTSKAPPLLDRFKNPHIAGAAAQISRQSVTDLVFRRMWRLFQQADRRHDHSRRADAALGAAAFDEGLLYGVKLPGGGDAFDGSDPRALGLQRRNQATVDQAAVQQNGA